MGAEPQGRPRSYGGDIGRWSPLFLLPIITCILFPITFAITLGISVYTNHTSVELDFPYISETGTEPPESCIFGQLLNIAAVACGLTIYIRYRQTSECYNCRLVSPHQNRTNVAAMIIGMIASFGVSMVGNFQMTNLIIAHYIGAALAFIGGAIYSWIQCYISYKMLSLTCTKCMLGFRIVVSAITTLFLILTLIGANLFTNSGSSELTFRMLSTISEWVMAFGLALLFVSFSKEFGKTRLKRPKVSVFQLSTVS